MACIHQNSIFFNIHIPSSGKFEGWIGKSLNARDKSILQSNAPSPIWWRYGGRIWSCSLLIGCGIFDYQRVLFILRLARLLTAPLPAWACLRLIGFGRPWFPGLGVWGPGLVCIWPSWRGDLLFLLLYSTCSRKLSKLGNYFWIHGLY